MNAAPNYMLNDGKAFHSVLCGDKIKAIQATTAAAAVLSSIVLVFSIAAVYKTRPGLVEGTISCFTFVACTCRHLCLQSRILNECSSDPIGRFINALGMALTAKIVPNQYDQCRIRNVQGGRSTMVVLVLWMQFLGMFGSDYFIVNHRLPQFGRKRWKGYVKLQSTLIEFTQPYFQIRFLKSANATDVGVMKALHSTKRTQHHHVLMPFNQ